jgi:3-phenylpropionate/trans-cinnamate dioxygenase ferredoxin reductase subunit
LSAHAGGNLGGVFVLRTLADVDAIAPEFAAGRRVLIVGGGYIGLEAAVAASKGLQVTLIEQARRILQRVAAPETSSYFRNLHLSHGVSIKEGLGVARLRGNGRVIARISKSRAASRPTRLDKPPSPIFGPVTAPASPIMAEA